jgi:hypothetical protein
MSSCGTSSSTCCPAASCASATSASSPTGDAPRYCLAASSCSQVPWIPPREPHPLPWTILTRPCSGSVLSAEAPCTSPNGSPQLNCCYDLHPSLTYVPHEPATPASTSSRALACTVPLRLIKTVAETGLPQPSFAATSRQPISAQSMAPIDSPETQQPPHTPSDSLQPDRKYISPGSGERLPSSRCIRSVPKESLARRAAS